jgi:MarR family transcriptional regulator, organic hydroperoxide resistance regulator
VSEQPPSVDPRAALESQMSSDLRLLNAASDRITRVFAGQNDLSANDFRALLHVMVADAEGEPLTAGALGKRMQVSGGAVTHLVERMIATRHIRRASHEHDRRKVMLHYDDHGMAVAREFFAPLGRHMRDAFAELPDEDLEAAHRVFTAMVGAMQAYQEELADPK